jgi:hypothetical protein
MASRDVDRDLEPVLSDFLEQAEQVIDSYRATGLSANPEDVLDDLERWATITGRGGDYETFGPALGHAVAQRLWRGGRYGG